MKLSIRYKLLIPIVGSIIILIIAYGVLSIFTIGSTLFKTLPEIYELNLQHVEKCFKEAEQRQTVSENLKQMLSENPELLLSTKQIEQLMETYNQKSKVPSSTLAYVQEQLQSIKFNYDATLIVFDQSYTVVASNVESLIGTSYSAEKAAALENSNPENGETILLNDISYLADGHTYKDYSLVMLISEDALMNLSGYLIIMILVFAVIIILDAFFIVIIVVRKTIDRPLQAIKTVMDKIAAGDFSERITIKGNNDEISFLSKNLNSMADRIEDIFTQIQDTSSRVETTTHLLRDIVDSSAPLFEKMVASITKINESVQSQFSSVEETSAIVEQMVSSVESVGSHIDNQSSAVSQTAASVEEMAASINSVANITGKANTVAKKLADVAQEGSRSVKASIEAIRDIEISSNQISEMVDLISNIAEQTNLLAMNAAIEAAHAGEAGKGFAVVADEIRKLAEDSGNSAEEIVTIITEILEKISNTVKLAEHAGEGLTNMMEDIEETTQINREINEAMQQQDNAANEVLKTITSLTQITEEVKSATVIQRTGSREILNTIEHLQQITQIIVESVLEETDTNQAITEAIHRIQAVADEDTTVVNTLASAMSFFKVGSERTIEPEIKGVMPAEEELIKPL
jgi:methyl-accepting chemotaxis protein